MNALTQVQEMEITVKDGKAAPLEVAVMPQTLVSDLIRTLREEDPKRFPTRDSENRLVLLEMFNTRTNFLLDSNQDMQTAGVQTGDLLVASHKLLNALG